MATVFDLLKYQDSKLKSFGDYPKGRTFSEVLSIGEIPYYLPLPLETVSSWWRGMESQLREL
jgi:hypothetical protein